MIAGELDEGACFQVEVYMTEQFDGTGKPLSGGDDDVAAAGGGTGPDRLPEGHRIQRLSVTGSAIIREPEFAGGKLRERYGRHRKRRMLDGPGNRFWCNQGLRALCVGQVYGEAGKQAEHRFLGV